MENLNIGVLGGMGTYATIHLFKYFRQKKSGIDQES